jgi:hypothetical protein
MIEDMQLRNLAAGTQKHYISLVAGFAKYFGTSPENLPGTPSLRVVTDAVVDRCTMGVPLVSASGTVAAS